MRVRFGIVFTAVIVAVLNGVAAGGRSVSLDWRTGGNQPVEVIDFGPQTVGGYAVFEVAEFTPAADGSYPVVRLSYATHPDGLSPTGDFTREGHADYLHVDNPVLPANINRHELYTIPRTGTFVAPLVQGQERYVRVALDTPGTAVSLASLDIVNAGVHSEATAVGSFACDDPRAKAVWDMGVRTCQLASFPNPDAWRVVAGVLIPRKLKKGSADGWCRFVPDFEGTLEVAYEFRLNPHFPNCAFKVFTGWRNAEPDVLETIKQEGPDGVIKTASIPLKPGRFGFRLAKEEWPMVHSVVVKDKSGTVRWRDDFKDAPSGKAVNWVYATAVPYLADGGKRDRLVWSGDLWWAQRTVYDAFGPNDPYLAGALRLLAFNQTPEGFCHAAPYAENDVKPMSGDYGHFASDEFSAWLVPCAWEHYLFTGDEAFARELWPAVDRDLRYLASRMGDDGLFAPRFETSKHAMRMECGDLRKRVYQNVIFWMCWRDGAKLARALGHSARAAELEGMAARHAQAIRARFKDAASGRWNTVLGAKGEDGPSCMMMLASGFATREEAIPLARKFRFVGVGKFQSLVVRGKFRYGFTQGGLRAIGDGNWHSFIDPAWKGARCCTECMYLTTKGWWDESHPDTTISDVYTSYLLGVEPAEPGFRVFTIAPQMAPAITRAEGVVPTPHGNVEVAWQRVDGTLTIDFTVPEGTAADVAGGPGAGPRRYGPGRHSFTRAVPPEELVDPSFAEGTAEGPQTRDLGFVTSQPFDDASARYAQTFDLDAVAAVDSVTFFPSGEGFPDSLTIEGGDKPGEFRKLASRTGLKSADKKKPLTIDLRTVVGAPDVRYLRLSGEGLAPCRDGQNWVFRFANIRVNFTVR